MRSRACMPRRCRSTGLRRAMKIGKLREGHELHRPRWTVREARGALRSSLVNAFESHGNNRYMNILTIFLRVASAGAFGCMALACGSTIEAATGSLDGANRDSHALLEDAQYNDSRAPQARDAGHTDSAEQAAPGDAG